jgi:transposase
MSAMDLYVGIDVSKATLDVAVFPSGETWTSAHNESEIEQLTRRLGQLQPKLIVLEATGGLETDVVASLWAAPLPVFVVNPRQMRHFAKGLGLLAKTDKLDAHAIARFGEAVKPSPRPLPDGQTQGLNALITRRRQIIGMQTAEKNRLGTAPEVVQERIQAHLDWFTAGTGYPERRPGSPGAREPRMAREGRSPAECAWRGRCDFAQPHRLPAGAWPSRPQADRRPGRAGSSQPR